MTRRFDPLTEPLENDLGRFAPDEFEGNDENNQPLENDLGRFAPDEFEGNDENNLVVASQRLEESPERNFGRFQSDNEINVYRSTNASMVAEKRAVLSDYIPRFSEEAGIIGADTNIETDDQRLSFEDDRYIGGSKFYQNKADQNSFDYLAPTLIILSAFLNWDPSYRRACDRLNIQNSAFTRIISFFNQNVSTIASKVNQIESCDIQSARNELIKCIDKTYPIIYLYSSKIGHKLWFSYSDARDDFWPSESYLFPKLKDLSAKLKRCFNSNDRERALNSFFHSVQQVLAGHDSDAVYKPAEHPIIVIVYHMIRQCFREQLMLELVKLSSELPVTNDELTVFRGSLKICSTFEQLHTDFLLTETLMKENQEIHEANYVSATNKKQIANIFHRIRNQTNLLKVCYFIKIIPHTGGGRIFEQCLPSVVRIATESKYPEEEEHILKNNFVRIYDIYRDDSQTNVPCMIYCLMTDKTLPSLVGIQPRDNDWEKLFKNECELIINNYLENNPHVRTESNCYDDRQPTTELKYLFRESRDDEL